jgi:uncharacterized glyoxalase superfamily protein PhnB
MGFKFERQVEQAVAIKDEAGLTIFLFKTSDPSSGPKITLTIQVDNVDGKHEELAKRGVEPLSSPKLHFWGYGLEVVDPDGYKNHLWDEVTMAAATRQRKSQE